MSRNYLEQTIGKPSTELLKPTPAGLHQPLIEQWFDQSKETTRAKLFTTLSAVFDKLPIGVDLAIAIEQQLVTSAEVLRCFQLLNSFLDEDQNHWRILLYLPFELLPAPGNDTVPTELEHEFDKFRALIPDLFLRLAFESDVRAAFTNGDVLEPGMGTPERTRKIAHLIPFLLEKSLLLLAQIRLLLDVTDGRELICSLLEGLWVAYDKQLIKPADWDELLKSEWCGQTLNLVREYRLVLAQEPLTSPTMSNLRSQWIERTQLEKQLQQLAQIMVDQIEADEITIDQLRTKLRALSDTEESAELVRTIGARLSLVDPTLLESSGIAMPDFTTTRPISLESIEQSLQPQLSEALANIQQQPLLKESLYPVILVYGSRVKGYAVSAADCDLGIFFRTNVSLEQKEEILHSLRSSCFWLQDKPIVTFWFDEVDEHITFRPDVATTRMIAGKDQLHFLLGGSLFGNNQEVQIIQRMLEREYAVTNETKPRLRQQYLGQLEADAVQFRLLHKGYYAWYPDQKLPPPTHGKLIDWDSAFYDPGFRRVATLQFLSKVWLPTAEETTAG